MAGCGEKGPTELIESAKTSISKQDHQAAIVELKSAIQKAPDNAEARMLLGRAYLETGDDASADKDSPRTANWARWPTN